MRFEKRVYYSNDIYGFMNKACDEIFNEKFDSELEYFMLQMRLCHGVDSEKYREKLNKDMPKKFFETAKKYSKLGFCETKDDKNIRFTDKGFLVSNYIISEILQI